MQKKDAAKATEQEKPRLNDSNSKVVWRSRNWRRSLSQINPTLKLAKLVLPNWVAKNDHQTNNVETFPDEVDEDNTLGQRKTNSEEQLENDLYLSDPDENKKLALHKVFNKNGNKLKRRKLNNKEPVHYKHRCDGCHKIFHSLSKKNLHEVSCQKQRKLQLNNSDSKVVWRSGKWRMSISQINPRDNYQQNKAETLPDEVDEDNKLQQGKINSEEQLENDLYRSDPDENKKQCNNDSEDWAKVGGDFDQLQQQPHQQQHEEQQHDDDDQTNEIGDLEKDLDDITADIDQLKLEEFCNELFFNNTLEDLVNQLPEGEDIVKTGAEASEILPCQKQTI